MVGKIETDNWLDSKEIECAQCGQKLHWLRHSPMYDEIFFYCTQCPMRVDISYYDDHAIELRQTLEKKVGTRATKQFSRLYIDLLEQNLMACDCGGKFAYDAPRRCLRCFVILPQSEPGRDVFPPESPDASFSLDYQSLSLPTRSLIKTANIWKS
ncbi:MAG TPA: hypothetical protein VF493_14615 [Terriglobales bacterium]